MKTFKKSRSKLRVLLGRGGSRTFFVGEANYCQQPCLGDEKINLFFKRKNVSIFFVRSPETLDDQINLWKTR